VIRVTLWLGFCSLFPPIPQCRPGRFAFFLALSVHNIYCNRSDSVSFPFSSREKLFPLSFGCSEGNRLQVYIDLMQTPGFSFPTVPDEPVLFNFISSLLPWTLSFPVCSVQKMSHVRYSVFFPLAGRRVILMHHTSPPFEVHHVLALSRAELSFFPYARPRNKDPPIYSSFFLFEGHLRNSRSSN